MPHSLTDLVAADVRAEDFVATVLDSAAQPIWVMDGGGVIRFANAAAVAALGYDHAEELVGREGHATVHDHAPSDAAGCSLRAPLATGETVRRDLDWFLRRDGSTLPVSYTSAPIALREGRGVVVSFTDVTERLRTEQALEQHDSAFATREAALRRIAALVAQNAASRELFAAIAEEVAAVMDVPLVVVWHIDIGGPVPERPALVVGAWGECPHPFREGSTWAVEEEVAEAMVPGLNRPVRVEDFAAVGGEVAEAIAATGIRAGAGAAIIVDGEPWGSMGVGATRADEPLREGIEDQLAEFTDLLSTTINNSENRERLTDLAHEQAALRRVATLVARAVALPEVLDAVAREVGAVLDVAATRVTRSTPDAAGELVAAWRRDEDDDDGRGDDITAPIVVDQRVWGTLVVSCRRGQVLATDAETRIAAFTDLVVTAIANAEARDEVAASRARIVAAADDERRRVVRDLHDGAQQRLVHTVITLKLAQGRLATDAEAAALVTEALEQAEEATAELRELAHGILPAVLTRGGLPDGVEALALRTPVTVRTDVAVDRLPAVVEATAYFVVAEALTNVAKHARATRSTITARVVDGSLRLEVRDDGVGGARPDGGGLLGLADRLDVLGGRLWVESPDDGGTLVAAEIPLPAEG